MVDQIHADGLVLAGLEGDLELAADAIGAAHQYRVVQRAGGGQVEQSAERPDVGQDALPESAAGDQTKTLDDAHLRVDVDAGVLVSQTARRAVPARGGCGTRDAFTSPSLDTPWHRRRYVGSRLSRRTCGFGGRIIS